MKYLEKNKIKNEIIESLIDKLYEYEDTKEYACELSYILFEHYNVDCTITYNTREASEWIKNNFNDLGEIVEEIKFQGLEIPNVFDEPEKFQVVIYLEVANYILNQCKFIEDNWDDEIELNKENIEIIKKQLENQKEA